LIHVGLRETLINIATLPGSKHYCLFYFKLSQVEWDGGHLQLRQCEVFAFILPKFVHLPWLYWLSAECLFRPAYYNHKPQL